MQPSAASSRGRAVTWLVGGVLFFSIIFFSFAGGMVFHRYVVAPDARAQSTAQGESGQVPAQIQRAWEAVQQDYVDVAKIDDERMLEGAIDGMLQTLDDEGHTRYMTPEEAQANAEDLSGEYVGVGVQVEDSDEGIVVVTPIDNSPAMEAGIKPGDIIVSLDGVDITDKTVDEVINDIRGEEGTQVTLGIRRPGEEQLLSFTLTRRKIELSPVSWVMLEGNIADVRLSQFSEGAGDDLQDALREARAAGATSVILDLRNNPGGFIHEALQVGSTFVPKGSTIFITQVRDGTQTEQLAEAQETHIGDTPLVVLINEGSASSSEIVAGAIKAHNPNATVIGETTFGTGTVLSHFDLGDGHALWLGTELWLTPEGKLIKDHGIRPDVLVGLPEGQSPFIPVDNVDPEPGSIQDHQLDWAIDIIQAGEAGDENPLRSVPPSRGE
jgi:carboxyl-terminal processing protease